MQYFPIRRILIKLNNGVFRHDQVACNKMFKKLPIFTVNDYSFAQQTELMSTRYKKNSRRVVQE
jgi:hypothetical protein